MAQGPATRAVAATLALLGWFALGLQLYLMMRLNGSQNIPLSFTLTNFFSFFTILGNLLVAIVCTFAALTLDKPSPNVQAAVLTYIVIVSAGYSLLLRHIWNPQGTQKLADELLHDVIPVLYFLFWLAFCRRRRPLAWGKAFKWLIFPGVYLLCALTRSSVTGWYPYPFLDPAQVSKASIFIVIFVFLVAFILIGLVVIALTRRNRADTLQQ